MARCIIFIRSRPLSLLCPHHPALSSASSVSAKLLRQGHELNRFSLDTKSRGLQFAADGSLTLYVQRERPSEERVANWLLASLEPLGDLIAL